ncbi:MAG: MotA/TolQ/ExbB proton channel family protein [Candidatus Accumulibacter sp.]|jgi:biopolymer transport protein ExbB|nr:MotA/TolQ/ExbB proton channel family protein [Accumulibacter sp.]
MSENAFGLAHFLSQTDAVGLSTFAILASMSLLSWYQIAVKSWRYVAIRARSRAFLAVFRRGDEARRFGERPGDDPFAHVLGEGLLACRLLKEGVRGERAFEMAAPDDFLAAALQRAVAGESRRLDGGLTILASVASSAPFIGLFGTVWGIYHALLSIGVSGQASLDKVAGPVGEALVMTACGLFVAIPAVLAYNAFTRFNRDFVGELESHAHDVFGLLGLGRLASSLKAAGFPAASASSVLTPAAEGAR